MAMTIKMKNPVALAGAHRVEVTQPAGKSDIPDSTPSALDLQVRRLVARYAVSLSLAMVIAELAFTSGRRS